VVDEARAEAGRRRNEADDYCDKRLAQLETVLEKAMTVVATGRARLRGDGPAGTGTSRDAGRDAEDGGAGVGAAGLGSLTVGAGPEGEATHSAFFDQDRI
jgi:hypothetical protein